MSDWLITLGILALFIAAACAVIIAADPKRDDETEAWARFREGMRGDGGPS